MKTAFMTALVAFAAAPVAANADAEQLYFDPNHTQISVDWAHAAGAPLTFYFTDWDAELMYDAENIENSSVNVTLPLTGLWTGIDGFTDHLQSDDFFTAETWPSASFTSTSVTRTGDDTAELTGDLDAYFLFVTAYDAGTVESRKRLMGVEGPVIGKPVDGARLGAAIRGVIQD